MLRYLLNSDFCIHVLKNKPQELCKKFNENAAFLCISDIVLYELFYNAECSDFAEKNHKQVKDFISHLTVIPFDSNAAFHAGQIRHFLEQKENIIGAYDLMIAGQARSLGLTIITNNLEKFSVIPGLQCEAWN